MNTRSEITVTPIFLVTTLAVAVIAGGLVKIGNHANSSQGQPAYEKSNMTSAANASMAIVYRCDAAGGKPHYLSYPRAGCEEIYVVSPISSAIPPALVSYRNRDAGYQWAQSHNVTHPSDCSGDSQGFVIGCQAYITQAIAWAETSWIDQSDRLTALSPGF